MLINNDDSIMVLELVFCVLFWFFCLVSCVMIVDVFIFNLIFRLISVNVIGNVKLIVVSGLVLSKLIKKVFISLKFIIMIMLIIIGIVICFSVWLILLFIRFLDLLFVVDMVYLYILGWIEVWVEIY